MVVSYFSSTNLMLYGLGLEKEDQRKQEYARAPDMTFGNEIKRIQHEKEEEQHQLDSLKRVLVSTVNSCSTFQS